MAVSTASIQLTGLARKLVMDGLMEEETAAEAWEEALSEKVPFVRHAVQKGLIDAAVVAQVAAEEFGVPVLDISAVELDPDIVKSVAEKLIRDHYALPVFKRGTRLFIAVSDPTHLQALDEIKSASSCA